MLNEHMGSTKQLQPRFGSSWASGDFDLFTPLYILEPLLLFSILTEAPEGNIA